MMTGTALEPDTKSERLAELLAEVAGYWISRRKNQALYLPKRKQPRWDQ